MRRSSGDYCAALPTGNSLASFVARGCTGPHASLLDRARRLAAYFEAYAQGWFSTASRMRGVGKARIGWGACLK